MFLNRRNAQVSARSALLCILLLTIAIFHAKLNESINDGISTPEFIPSYQAVRLVSLGNEKLIADFYWLKFISYVGDSKERTKDHYRYAESYLELITSLDPQFVSPYWFTAFTIGGDLRRPLKAAEILHKGVIENEDSWVVPCIAGVNQYLFAHNESSAAEYYRLASKCKNAPNWLARQALILNAHIPSSVKEAMIWTNIFHSAQNESIRDKAKGKAVELWSRIYLRAPTERLRAQAKMVLDGFR